jgi:pyruvate/2-oxoglutarate dehydrogenase complex dihydrolipoamide acyltransferase (E2) component
VRSTTRARDLSAGAAGPVPRETAFGGNAVARVLRMPEVADDTGSARLTEWLVGESGDFVGAQSIATVETDSSLLSIEVAEAGVLIKSLVSPGQHVEPGSALAVLAAPGEVVEDVEQLMQQLGLAIAPDAQVAGVQLRAVSAEDPLAATTWPPHETVEEPTPVDEQEALEAEPEAPTDDTSTDTAPTDDMSTGDLPTYNALTYDASTYDTAPTDTAPTGDTSSDGTVPADPVGGPVLGWVDAVAEAVVAATLAGDARPLPGPAPLRQMRLGALVRADRLLDVTGTVESVSLIGLAVKAVATTCRRVPLEAEASTIAAVAVQRRTPSGTFAPVVHVANLMTASSLTSTIANLDARGRGGEPEPASVLIVDLADYGVAEGAMDATQAYPAVLTIGQVRGQAVVEDGVLVPAQVLSVTLSYDANRVDVTIAARWLAELGRLLEEPLRFLT